MQTTTLKWFSNIILTVKITNKKKKKKYENEFKSDILQDCEASKFSKYVSNWLGDWIVANIPKTKSFSIRQ